MAGRMRVQLPQKMAPFATERCRHKIARGGRGSAKSWTIARLLILRAMQQRTRWLCCREIQKSIKESSHKLLSLQIAKLGLSQYFDIQNTVIRGPHGSEFLFIGLQDHTADAVKSLEDLDGAWVEEAHTITRDSANKLIPTVRNEGSEIWWSYNPDLETDFVHELAESGRDDVLVVTINYHDNRWFPDVLDGERVRMLAINQDLHDHIWGGKCRTAAGVLFKRRWFKRFKLGEQPRELNKYLSTDYAGAPDPDDPEAEPDFTEHGMVGIDQNKHWWFIDWWYDQTDPATYIAAWLGMIAAHGPLRAFEEKGVILRSVDKVIRDAMVKNQTFVRREPITSAGSKADRALGFAAIAATGIVHIPEGEWGDRLINQLCAFTGQEGRKDDAVDVCSLLARGLDKIAKAEPDVPETKPEPVKPFSVEWLERSDAEESIDTEEFMG